ncbi:MAG TPA: M28 family peptidase [Bryobacteraceae bacterium]|nr:M28 family peptidase [Bryobacteraceae bacterium]
MMRVSVLVAAASLASAANFSGASAFNFTRQVVAFGVRPSGSEANRKLQNYILAEIRKDGCEVSEDAFTASTPKGPIAMKNIICKFPGKSGKAIAITGHYDTKLFPGRHFVGANDAGSSTGFLLEMARVLAHDPHSDDIYLVWFDGEEAVREQWEGVDNLYGSRHLAEKWHKDGTLARMRALINVDMIGDKNLDIKQETNSNAALNKLVWDTARALGYGAYFLDDQLATEDDHQPFLKLGVPAIDLIDFDYPPWHEDSDTMDKLSAQSLEIVGTVVLETVHRLEH